MADILHCTCTIGLLSEQYAGQCRNNLDVLWPVGFSDFIVWLWIILHDGDDGDMMMINDDSGDNHDDDKWRWW